MTLYNKCKVWHLVVYGCKILSIGNCHIFGTSSFIKTIIQFSAPSYKNIRLNPVTTAINDHQI